MKSVLRLLLILLVLLLGALSSRAQGGVYMSGPWAYNRVGPSITFGVARITNYDPWYTTSGSLTISLWATAAPYPGGLLVGYKLCEVGIGMLQGGYYLQDVVRTTSFSAPPPGIYNIVFVLSEWNGFQYVVDDSANFTSLESFGTPPLITSNPLSQRAKVGGTVSFAVAAVGSAPLSVQWYFNSQAIPGAVNATLTINNVQPAYAGSYYAMVVNPVGYAVSAAAVLTVNAPISITSQPHSQTVAKGGTATFAVTATGIPAPAYKWRFNGANIPGATLSTYTRLNVQTNDAGNYRVILSNTLGSVTSVVAVLTVTVPPSITLNPQGQAVKIGSNVTFTVSATGTAPLRYRWWWINAGGFTNTSPSWTNASLKLLNVQATNAGMFYAVVTNSAGRATSAMASLTVLSPPAIISQPQSQTILAGGVANFSVVPAGTPPLSYQWKFNGTNLDGATAGTLGLTNVQLSQAGKYSVQITNLYGPTKSSDAVLIVNLPPPCVTPAAGLVSWWKAEGNADDAVSGNSGVLLNGATFAPGRVGQAFSFDGTGSYIEIADSPSLHFTNALTIEAWIYPTSLGAWHNIVSKWDLLDPLQTSYTTSVDPDGHLGFGVCASGNQSVTPAVATVSTNSVLPNQWTHFAVTYDGSALRMYLNGICEDQVAYNQGIFAGTDPLAIGAAGAFAGGQVLSPFAGLIDEPAVYNRALSGAEIQSIYNAGSAGKCPPSPAIYLSIAANPLRLTLSVAEGTTNQIESSPDLKTWAPYGQPFLATNRIMYQNVNTPDPQQYFRIRQAP